MNCRCKNPRHANHAGGPCTAVATETDNYCKPCHDKAANEAAAAIQPTNIPIQLLDRFRLSDSLSVTKVTEYYKRNVGALLLSLVLTVLASAIGMLFSGVTGFVFGVIVGLFTLMFLPPIKEKIREIERRS